LVALTPELVPNVNTFFVFFLNFYKDVINISILQFFSFIIYLHVFYVGASVLTNFASLINEVLEIK